MLTEREWNASPDPAVPLARGHGHVIHPHRMTRFRPRTDVRAVGLRKCTADRHVEDQEQPVVHGSLPGPGVHPVGRHAVVHALRVGMISSAPFPSSRALSAASVIVSTWPVPHCGAGQPG